MSAEENKNFLKQAANNKETKVCFLCGLRHEIEVGKLVEAFFVTMICPVEKVRLGGRTQVLESFIFTKKHILK